MIRAKMVILEQMDLRVFLDLKDQGDHKDHQEMQAIVALE